MPELPEVETVRRGLEKLVVGKCIESVTVKVPKMIVSNPETFAGDLTGQEILSIGRRGKYLIFRFSDLLMISHLRMEGKYLIFEGAVPENKHFHVFFHFRDGSTLVYQDVRKFGTLELIARDGLDLYFSQRKLGPEPTKNEFKLKIFETALRLSKKPIKPLLLEQKVVAGLGNIYVDEVLWAAKVHPLRLAADLKKAEIKRIHDQTVAILAFAIDKGGSTIRTYQNTLGMDGCMQDYLQVYGQTGKPCPRCGSAILKLKVGGRGTHYCPKCQKL
ncbi:formamidopyrimidine-DNA glycosylase [Streptococcus pseudoporcinus]|uniref:Formamidopyrimidine-DNA glycosylase n=1 Tax=Streptococcus pseudoporcinus TaxID=361101 RepID=A0A4U9XVD4_9STRE|nr:DNA-formamidopyrimidine glycosylase [Streptococcus pseudoporcinus]VTS16651.1 formamidopyrimidine-DNA glycosylase [Streptococcus pseudoporcinus]